MDDKITNLIPLQPHIFFNNEFYKEQPCQCLYFGQSFSGCVGAVHLINGDYHTTALCIIISLVLDFLMVLWLVL